jgi:hypothetical protein
VEKNAREHTVLLVLRERRMEMSADGERIVIKKIYNERKEVVGELTIENGKTTMELYKE